MNACIPTINTNVFLDNYVGIASHQDPWQISRTRGWNPKECILRKLFSTVWKTHNNKKRILSEIITNRLRHIASDYIMNYVREQIWARPARNYERGCWDGMLKTDENMRPWERCWTSEVWLNADVDLKNAQLLSDQQPSLKKLTKFKTSDANINHNIFVINYSNRQKRAKCNAHRNLNSVRRCFPEPRACVKDNV